MILELDASTPKGKPFKALLLGSSEAALEKGFSGDMRVRAKKTEVNGQALIAGFAAFVDQSSSNSKFSGFAFLATKEGMLLKGPELGSVYNLDGAATARSLCNNENVFGAALFKNRVESVRIVSAFLATQNSFPICEDGQTLNADVHLNVEAEVVETHLGKVLSSYGSMQIKSGEASYTLPVFTLAVAEKLSDGIKQQQFEGKAADNMFIFDPFAASELLRVQKGVMYFRELPESLLALEEGSLIVSRPYARIPEGLFRRVTSINNGENGVAVATEQAVLTELLSEGEFIFDRQLTDEDIVEIVPLIDGLDVSSFGLNSGQFSTQSISPISIPSVNIIPGVTVDIDLDLSLRPVVSFKCQGALCSKPEIVGKVVVNQSATVEVTGEGDFSKGKEIELFSFTFTPITVAIPPIPIVIVPKLVVYLELSGDGTASITSKITQSIDIEAGIQKPSGQPWEKINEVDKTFDFETPTFSGSMEAEARLAAAFEAALWGILGASVDFGPFARLEVNYPGEPAWKLTGGINSFATFFIDLLIISAEEDFKIFEKSWDIAEGENQKAEITSVNIDGPTTVSEAGIVYQLGSTLNFEAEVFDPEEGQDCCEVTWIVSAPPGSGENVSSISNAAPHSFSFSPNAIGDYTLFISVDDGAELDGESTSLSFSVGEFDISIESLLPTFTLQKITVGNPTLGQPVIFEATTSSESDPNCCDLTWLVDGEEIKTTTGASHSLSTSFLKTGLHTVEVKLEVPELTLGYISLKRNVLVQLEPINPPEINWVSTDRAELDVDESFIFTWDVQDDSTDPCCEVEIKLITPALISDIIIYRTTTDTTWSGAGYRYYVPYSFDTAGEKEILFTVRDEDNNTRETTLIINVAGGSDFFTGATPLLP